MNAWRWPLAAAFGILGIFAHVAARIAGGVAWLAEEAAYWLIERCLKLTGR